MFGFLKKNKSFIYAPVSGSILDLTEVKDEVFSSGMMGNGIAIIPSEKVFKAPADGVVTLIHESKHAFGMKLDNGVEILVHIGLNTVNFKGEGFKTLVNIGDHVKKRTPIVEVDLDFFKEMNVTLETPMILLNEAEQPCDILLKSGNCQSGETELIKVN
ncbi:PTS glucose transporter subunit IIA [Clostridioides sp. ES-S-0108-01]|uniref:PTS sugar transporter subunit IIA n=1 Tax=unclassified Clostridioides TaxID=2635829 RepID=UPI001D0C9BC1|nr:PTS glucose transporter subunit IIA [Clostridioides sp. ES-S-0171-01]MCC0784353.1 PTS glucose transporter subunit IIA [Clostridioides sp. ES-S-0108-01]UDN51688.1 PTS glucose transporter subunit IIA [Clostridioides sp. ES-S-0107-01]UDN55179.1 PTS glucose transporter subunit IIA [Clostridioides sp. ES-S-0054-01]